MQTANLFTNEVGGGMMLSWGGVVGSQNSGFEDLFGHQMKSSVASKEKTGIGKHFATTTRHEGETEHVMLGLGNPAKFTIFHGDGQNSACKEKLWLQKSDSIPIAIIEHPKQLELGFHQPKISSGFPYGEKYSGVLSTYGSQLTGRVMLPLNSDSDEGVIFVNAKQYKGIIRRRMYRAKAELKNKALKKTKPYLHLSRHLHAMRRPRGCGGRFLNTKELSGSNDKNAGGGGGLFWPTGSQASDDHNLHSPSSKSINSVSEVTSSYSREDHVPFLMNDHLHTAVFSMPNMMNACHGMECCNLEI